MCKYKEKQRIIIRETNQSLFCNTTIEYIEENQHVKSGYFLTKNNSKECENIFFQNSNNNIDLSN